jgi:hypothetical protein
MIHYFGYPAQCHYPTEGGCMSLCMLVRNCKHYQIAKSHHDNEPCDTGLVLWRLVTIYFCGRTLFSASGATQKHTTDA